MISATWKKSPANHDFNNGANWVGGNVPSATATFGASKVHSITISTDVDLGAFSFTAKAPHYVFHIAEGESLKFAGAGITGKTAVTIVNEQQLTFAGSSSAGKAHVTNNWNADFLDSSTAGKAHLVVNHSMSFTGNSHGGHAHIVNNASYPLTFSGSSNAEHAIITNNRGLEFYGSSSAGNAVITTGKLGWLQFSGNADGGNARLITKAGGSVDFSATSGASGNNFVGIGSIEGAGDYYLGGRYLDVGLNNRSTTVTGRILDGGALSGSGAALTKFGNGTLTLANADNNYSGGTAIGKGTLYLKVAGAAGTGDISFVEFSMTHETHQTLKLANKALPSHQFTTGIEGFGRGDAIDLTGLKFAAGAKATYDFDNGVLKVKSGHVTDTFVHLEIDFTFGTTPHFKVTNDGHGGTKVVYAPKPAHAKPAQDSFAFNAEVSHARHASSDADASEHTPTIGADLHDAQPTAFIDLALHPHTEAADFWHQS